MKDNIIKKIDSLGRIVIPKEYRKKLNINLDDDIEIILLNESLILKKYYKIDNNYYKINKLISLFENKFNIKIYLTDKDKIIYPDVGNNKLSLQYIKMIEERREIVQNGIINLNENTCLFKNKMIIPLIIDSSLLGSIVFCTDNIDSRDIKIFKMFSELIENELDN